MPAHNPQLQGLVSRPANQCSANQSGATLVVCLVILAILTLIGLGSMSITSLETAMVRNNQMSLIAYNNSLSEINGQISIVNVAKDPSLLLDALNSNTPNPSTGYPYRQLTNAEETMYGVTYGSTSLNQEVEFDYLGEGIPIGASESVIRSLNYDIHSESLLAGTGSRSDQTQGIYYLAPR